MTKTIDIKAITITLLAAAVIALSVMAMTHHSVAIPHVQAWQRDTSWTGGWNIF